MSSSPKKISSTLIIETKVFSIFCLECGSKVIIDELEKDEIESITCTECDQCYRVIEEDTDTFEESEAEENDLEKNCDDDDE